jgi:hypothetical protein
MFSETLAKTFSVRIKIEFGLSLFDVIVRVEGRLRFPRKKTHIAKKTISSR